MGQVEVRERSFLLSLFLPQDSSFYFVSGFLGFYLNIYIT